MSYLELWSACCSRCLQTAVARLCCLLLCGSSKHGVSVVFWGFLTEAIPVLFRIAGLLAVPNQLATNKQRKASHNTAVSSSRSVVPADVA